MYAGEKVSRKSFQSTVRPSNSERLLENRFASTQRSPSVNFRKHPIKLKNVQLIQQSWSPTLRFEEEGGSELRFLADLVRKKQESAIKPDEKERGKDYHYYDMIVRDLISQIKNRSSKDEHSPLPPARKTPLKLSPARKTKDLQYCSIKTTSQREKMVFSLSSSGSDTVYERKITSYIEFLYKLNFANQMYVDLTLSRPKTIYRVLVGPGNNGSLIRSLLKRRFWLQIISSGQYHFSWTQQTCSDIHDSQTQWIPNAEKSRTKPIQRARILANSSQQQLSKILAEGQISQTNEWYERSDCGRLSCFQPVSVGRVTNHLPFNCIIGAKRILFKLLHWYYSQILKIDPFTILPKTYSFDPPNFSLSIKEFLEVHQNSQKIWIVKPGQNTNRGNGIKIVNTPKLVSLLGRERSRGPQVRPLIVQEYIKPFLYNGRKFDIRHYLLITSNNGNIRGYWYRQGYIRTSSEKYDIQDMDEMIHLTNDAVQKKGERYGKYEQANKLSYAQFQRYLDTSHPHKHFNFENILSQMKEITTQMMRASFQYLDPQRRMHNFELYGLDFYLSSKFKPYLIQCNANPCLQINCPILERIIPGAVEHALRISLDPLFPPPQHYPTVHRFSLCDRVLQKLKYELIFDQKNEGEAIRQKCRNTPLDLSGIRLKPQEDNFQDDGAELGEEAPLD